MYTILVSNKPTKKSQQVVKSIYLMQKTIVSKLAAAKLSLTIQKSDKYDGVLITPSKKVISDVGKIVSELIQGSSSVNDKTTENPRDELHNIMMEEMKSKDQDLENNHEDIERRRRMAAGLNETTTKQQTAPQQTKRIAQSSFGNGDDDMLANMISRDHVTLIDEPAPPTI